jgi:hypothetical protein
MPKTIEDIIPPSRRRAMAMDENATTPQQAQPMQPMTDLSSSPPSNNFPPAPPRVKIRTGRSFPYGTAIVALIVIALSAGVLYAFADAKVEITPTSQTGAVSGEFTATAGSGTLPFSVISVTKTASASVPAESTESANDSAQGQIIISNTGTAAESFVTNTRFETASGLVFRVHTPVTIPPASASGPGTLQTTIYADQPGQSYNIGPSTFSVPGLQGTPQYTQVTAKSTTSMLGGFTGTRASVSQSTDDAQHTTLQTSLATQLQGAINDQVPSGDVLLQGATFTSYTPAPDSATTTTSVSVSEDGTMTAVVFPESALASAIAYKIAGTYSGEPVTMSSVSGLSLTPAVAAPPASGDQSFDFTLNGSATILWQVDASKIAGAVAGKTRDSAQQILSGFP